MGRRSPRLNRVGGLPWHQPRSFRKCTRALHRQVQPADFRGNADQHQDAAERELLYDKIACRFCARYAIVGERRNDPPAHHGHDEQDGVRRVGAEALLFPPFDAYAIYKHHLAARGSTHWVSSDCQTMITLTGDSSAEITDSAAVLLPISLFSVVAD